MTPPLHRRRFLQASLHTAAGAAVPPAALGLWPDRAAAAADDDGRKVLRLLFKSAETSFDPARVTDAYSRAVTAHIFESLYAYDPLSRTPRMAPALAEALPEVDDNYRRFTVRLKRGVYFADDPAFGGNRREVRASDIAYAVQRLVDPANLSGVAEDMLQFGILGLAEVREAAIKGGKPFDYAHPIEGLQTPDSHTLVIRTAQPRPRLMWFFADPSILGAQAPEVVRHYGERVAEHPVGSGPFRLKSWRRSSRIVLERNPGYREHFYDAQPAPDDADGQAILARLKGRRVPMVDVVEVSVVEEAQPQWLSFLGGQVDLLGTLAGSVPPEFARIAAPGGRLAPNLAKRGIRLQRTLNADIAVVFFNMRDPVLGGTTPPQVALRRAISLGYDVDSEIRLVRRGMAMAGQSVVPPHTLGYDPSFRCEMGDYDPARAKALLDLYGFVDRDGDGWRERPDGSPLDIAMATETTQSDREYNDIWRKSMGALGLRIRFVPQQWSENFKAAQAGKLQMWMLGVTASLPDGQDYLTMAYGPNIGSGNYANFELPAFDRLYERMQALPDGPEREAMFREAKRLMAAYMPYRSLVHRFSLNLSHPWVIGFRRPLLAGDWWQWVDVDPALRAATLRA